MEDQVVKLFDRDAVRELQGKTVWVQTGCGKLYITQNFHEGKLVEVFCNLGHSGGCAAGYLETIGRLMSVGIQNGIDMEILVRQISGVKCQRPKFDNNYKLVESCPDALALVLTGGGRKKEETGEALKYVCESCGSGDLEFEGRCYTCNSCGWSKC